MSESAGLEGGYRRLLAWYPRSFRQEQEDEMLAVLMASAEPGQRRPRWLERVDLIRSALTMRLVRALRPAPVSQGWTRALAVFGVIAPVFLVMVAVLEVAVPYYPPTSGLPRGFLVGLGQASGDRRAVAAAGAVLRRRRRHPDRRSRPWPCSGGGAWR